MPGFFHVLQDFVKMVSPLICISHSLKVKIKFLLANYTRHNFCVLHAILDMHVISVNRIFYDVKEKIHDNLNHCKNNWPYHCTINLWTPSEVKRHLLTSCSEKQEDIYCLFPLLRIYKIWKKTQVKIWECKITIGKSSFRNILQICTYYKLSLHNSWQLFFLHFYSLNKCRYNA